MTDVKSPAHYVPLDTVLQECYRSHLKLRRNDTKRIFRGVEKKIEQVIQAMRNVDRGFAEIYHYVQPTGSFFDKLKIKTPDEIDLNVVIKITNTLPTLKVEPANSPRFVKLHTSHVIGKHMYNTTPVDIVAGWIDNNGYLCENRVREWFESLLIRTMKSRNHLFQEMSLRKSGPAFTLSMVVYGRKVDVDLVVALECPPSLRPPISSLPDLPQHPWFVITKSVGNENWMWQMSFPRHEKEILANNWNLKLVCKLIKAFKEKSQHMKISSYAIKTLFLLKQRKLGFDNSFWRQNIGYIFIVMLQELSAALRSGYLPYFWDDQRNLIKNFSVEHRVQLADYIDNVIKSVHFHINNILYLSGIINQLLV